MNFIDFSKEEQKLLDLLFSDQHANDLIAYEIVKHFPKDKFSILFFMSLILTSKSLAFKKEVYKYIRTNFSEEYHLGIRLLTMKKYGYFAIKPLLSLLEPTFSKIEILELFYRIIKRTGKSHDIFLIVDNGNHPKRAEVFQDFIKKEPRSRLNIPGLLPKEIEEYATIFLKEQRVQKPIIINLNSLKTPEVPAVLFTRECEYLVYRNDFLHDHGKQFPDFIFQFKGLKKITINLHPEVQVPNNWSRLNELKIIGFNKDGHVFQNLDFLDSMPSLKYVSGMMLGQPELFLQKKHIEISSSDIPERIKNVQRVILPDAIISQIGNDLKKSDLTIEKQKFYFNKLLIQKLSSFTEEEINELSTVDFERKVKRYFYRFMKQRFGPRLTEK